MKKFALLLCSLLMVLGVSGTALAIPTTWTDTIDFDPDLLVPPARTYTHDITDDTADGAGFDGFFMGNGGDDVIYSYALSVALYDDGGLFDYGEVAYINQPGLLGDSAFWNFSYVNSYGWSLEGIVLLNLTGQLEVTVSSWGGDFYLDSSTLIAKGDNGVGTAPVPEPATILLLGTGLLGMVGMGRKRLNKKG